MERRTISNQSVNQLSTLALASCRPVALWKNFCWHTNFSSGSYSSTAANQSIEAVHCSYFYETPALFSCLTVCIVLIRVADTWVLFQLTALCTACTLPKSGRRPTISLRTVLTSPNQTTTPRSVFHVWWVIIVFSEHLYTLCFRNNKLQKTPKQTKNIEKQKQGQPTKAKLNQEAIYKPKQKP